MGWNRKELLSRATSGNSCALKEKMINKCISETAKDQSVVREKVEQSNSYCRISDTTEGSIKDSLRFEQLRKLTESVGSSFFFIYIIFTNKKQRGCGGIF